VTVLRICSAGLVIVVGLFPALEARGQLFSYDADRTRSTQSLSLGYYVPDFRYDGEGEPEMTFDFRDPVYGFAYSRPNFTISAGIGNGTSPRDAAVDLRLFDASLFTWGEIRIAGSARSNRHRLFVPIALHSHYRRVSNPEAGDSSFDAFAITVLGLGTGMGYTGMLGRAAQLEMRAMPVLGLAARSFGDATGSSRAFDADVLLHVGPLAGRLGLTAGYGFRYQIWNVGASRIIATPLDDFYDYRGSQHVFRVGVNW
jgi:hypothetical protein